MTVKHYVLVGVALVFALVSPVWAGGLEGMYVGVKGIYSHQDISGPTLKTPGNTWGFGDESDGAAGGGLALGYDFDRRFALPLRVELEYALRDGAEPKWSGNRGIFIPGTFDWKLEAETEVDTLLVNLYYDVKNRTAFTPYIVAGAGYAFIDWTSRYTDSIGTTPVSADGDVTEFAWTVGLGCSYAVTEALMIDLGYRYVDAGTAEADYQNLTAEADIKLHEVVLGLRYAF